MSTYLEEAAAEIRKIQAANDKRDEDTRHLPLSGRWRGQVRETRQWVAHAWLALAAIERGQARVTLAVPVSDDPPGTAGEEKP